MPSSNDINSAFGDQWGLLLTVRFETDSSYDTIWTGTAFWFPFLLLYRLGLLSVFCYEYYIGLELLLCFLFQVLYEFGTAFPLEYYTAFELVLSQVGSVLQLYLRSFEVEGKP